MKRFVPYEQQTLVPMLVLGGLMLGAAILILEWGFGGWMVWSLAARRAPASVDLARYDFKATDSPSLSSAMERVIVVAAGAPSPRPVYIPVVQNDEPAEPGPGAGTSLEELVEQYKELGRSAESAKAKLELLPRMRLLLAEKPSELEEVSAALVEDITSPVAPGSQSYDPALELAIRAQNLMVAAESDPERALQYTVNGIQAQTNPVLKKRFEAAFVSRYPDRKEDLDSRLGGDGLSPQAAEPEP